MTSAEHDYLGAQHRQQLLIILAANGLVTLCLLIIVFTFALKPRTNPPYVIGIKQGEIVGVAKPLQDTAALQDQIVRYMLSEFIRNALTITPNINQMQEQVESAYAFVAAQADTILTNFYLSGHGENDMRKVYKKVYQDVHVDKILKLPTKDTWQIDFTTSRTSYAENKTVTTSWEAISKVQLGVRTALNPIGIYITTIDLESNQDAD